VNGLSFEHIPPRTEQWINVIVDTPAGSQHKYKFDHSIGYFVLSHTLPTGMVFPHDFGFIPGTMAEDGDSLDVMLIGEGATFTGCVQTAKLIGATTAIQTNGNSRVRNDRLLAVVANRLTPPKVQSITQLDAGTLRKLEGFFIAYNAQHNREFRPEGQVDVTEAEALLNQGIELFSKELETG